MDTAAVIDKERIHREDYQGEMQCLCASYDLVSLNPALFIGLIPEVIRGSRVEAYSVEWEKSPPPPR